LRALGAWRFLPLKVLDGLIQKPAAVHPMAGSFSPRQPCLGHLALFPGCVARHLDSEALGAAVKVLTHLGYKVSIPEQALCCGAMHRHEGLPNEAERELERCEHVFAAEPYDAIISLSSACTGELRRCTRMGEKIHDINRFLLDETEPEAIELRPLPERVSVHIPCTQRNLLRDPDAALRLLERIPNIQLQALAGNAYCCGAAGSYMLRQAVLSQQLRADKIAQLESSPPRYLVTSNIGCSLHLAAGLAEKGIATAVRHPIELLAAQLPTSPDG
jgi:glycolate oxidase iron-sulfur subunit